MKIHEIISETRQGLLRLIQREFPNVPEYIRRDAIYQALRTAKNREELQDILIVSHELFDNLTWKLEKIKITPAMFTQDTQHRMLERGMGRTNPYNVPRDKERNQTQAELIKQRGVSKEPITIIQRDDGYELIEGWHRTMQHLNAFPQGYVGVAWIGRKGR